VNCFLDAAVGALRDRCDGLTSCQVAADTFRLAPADPCPAHARYLEAHYVCNSRTGSIYTDKKENQIFLIYKEIQKGAVAKSYMTNGLLIYGEIHYFRISPIYEEAFIYISI
jgi:hypothetical protein